jgi:ubiquinone/menaquinone biosynthesis C-methylase UbiE
MAASDQHTSLKILDLGCGEGHITAKVQEILPNAELSGLDHSMSAIVTAVDNYSGIDFCAASAYRPPYNDDYFDIVVCNNIWEHVSDPVALLMQIRRITKPSGHLIISTPNRYRFGNLVRVLLGKSPSLMAPNHVTEYSIGQIIEQLRYGKYTVLEVYSRPLTHTKKTIKGLIGYNIVCPIVNGYLRLTKSGHRLEMTVFFLARKEHHQSIL